jgi:hypothetical protein
MTQSATNQIGVLTLFAVCVAGCASGPNEAKAKTEGPVHGVSGLPKSYPSVVEDWGHSTIDKAEFLQPFSLKDYQRVVIRPLDKSKVELPDEDGNTRKTVERAMANFENMLAEGMGKSLPRGMKVEILAANQDPAGGSLEVRGKVVEINPGSRALRAFAGLVGGGKSRTEIDGQIVDPSTGKTLVRFNHGKVSAAHLFGGDYDKLIRNDVTDIGEDVGKLIAAFNAAPPAATK